MKDSLTKGTIYLTFSSLLFIVSGYAINLWLGRSLGPEDYGIYGVIISIMNIVNIIQTSGLPRSLSKFTAEPNTNKDSLLKSSIILQISSSLALTLLLVIFSNVIAGSLNDQSLSKYIKFSALIFPFYGIYALYAGYYNGLHEFGRQAFLNAAYSVSKGAFVIIFALVYHLYGAIAGFIIAPLVALLVGVRIPDLSAGKFPYKKLIYFSLPLIAFAFFSTLQQSVDLYLIKSLTGGNAEAGYYTANQNIAKIPFFALSAFAAILFPSISKSVSEKTDDLTSAMISRSSKYVLIILLPMTIILSTTSGEIISLLFSKQYLPGAASLSILSVSFAFITMFSIFANILNGAGYPYKSALISASSVVLSVVLCFILIPRYQLTGAAIATGLSGLFGMSVAGVIVFRRFNIKIRMGSLAKIFFAGLIIFILSTSIHFSGIKLLIWCIFLGIFYTVSLVLLRIISTQDLKLILNILPNSIKLPLLRWTKEK